MAKPAAFRRLCVETIKHKKLGDTLRPAAFRRLCVETDTFDRGYGIPFQPPSGGCVLKPLPRTSGGAGFGQPPSGGCVLKQALPVPVVCPLSPAAFRRLCVETCYRVMQSLTA